MVFKSALANEAQQILHPRDLDDPRAAKRV
jgi:hypothetical protein